jgi:hypothetical protein
MTATPIIAHFGSSGSGNNESVEALGEDEGHIEQARVYADFALADLPRPVIEDIDDLWEDNSSAVVDTGTNPGVSMLQP